MVEFGKREAGAIAAVLSVAVVAGIGWSVLQQRQQATAADLKPTFADGTPAQTAGPDGTLDISAKGLEEDLPSPASPIILDAPSVKPDKILVFVSGAVKRPGVYALKPGAKVFQAVHAAHGFKPNADQEALNQAETLQDGDQIYIRPRGKASIPAKVSVASGTVSSAGQGEIFLGRNRRPVSLPPPAVTVRPLIIQGTTPSVSKGEAATEEPRKRGRVLGKPPVETVTIAAQSTELAPFENEETDAQSSASEDPAKPSGRRRSESSKTVSKFKNPGDGVVNINTADLAELQKLPGVGPSTAQKFIEYRTQIGRFASIEQVQDIKGIGPKKYAKLRPFISL